MGVVWLGFQLSICLPFFRYQAITAKEAVEFRENTIYRRHVIRYSRTEMYVTCMVVFSLAFLCFVPSCLVGDFFTFLPCSSRCLQLILAIIFSQTPNSNFHQHGQIHKAVRPKPGKPTPKWTKNSD